MKYLILAILAAFVLSGCGTVNPFVSAELNKAGQDYMGAKANIQQTDDMKLRLWIDGACAVNVGALQRAISTSGNPAIANAIFTACPVPAVGVTSTSATGSMQVQTFNLPPIIREPVTSAPVITMPAVTVSQPVPTSVTKAASKPTPAAIPAPTPQPVAQPVPQPAAPPFGTLPPNPNFKP